jgi:PAS domain S-box-containing protein
MNSAKISASRRTLRPDFSVRWRGALIISIPVLCLFTSVFVIAGLRNQTLFAVNKKSQSQEILLETERLLLSLVNAQTGVRGYALAKRQEFLKPYFQAKTSLPVSLKILNEQVKSNKLQRQQLQRISTQSQQQITVLDQLKTTSESQGTAALTEELLKSELLMDELRQEISKFAEQEKGLRSAHEAQVVRWRDLTNTVQWIALVIGLIGTFLALYLFNQLDEELVERAIRLRESNVYLQAVFDNVVDGIIILNERGYIQSANAAIEEIFGYNLEEIPGKHLQRLISESFTEDSGKVMNFLVGNNQDKLKLQQEIIGRCRDDKTFPMEFAFSKMQLDNEHLFIAIVRDITERKQAQETLLKQAQLLDLANDTIMVRDLNDTILYWNQGAQRLYGYSSADAVGQSVHNLLKTEFSQPPEEVKRILFKDGYWNGELVHYRRDGTPVTVASGLTLQRNEFGEPVAYLEINQDITQRKQSEAALRKSEELYRVLVKNFPNGAVFLFDEQLRYNIAEGTGLATLNFTSEELIGKTIWEILPPQTVQVIEPLYRAALRGEVTVREVPYDDRLYIIHVLPVTNADGEILAGMAMTQDITDRKKAEEALRSRAEELAQMTTALAQTTAVLEKNYSELDQFAYIVSHDLKAPLRAIANLSQWIEDDLEQQLTKDTRHQMDLMRNRVHRMEALIDGLLQYSRSSRLQANLEQVDVEELLKDAIDSLAPPPNFTVTIMPGMPKIITERLPLEQVFANLISNAIKHNKQPQGQVVISAKEQPNFYEFAVADNGIGIALEFQEKVFGLFQTISSSENLENTGIGLAIVKKIIEDRGGKISIESQLGQGATFRFTWLKQIRESEGE